MTMNRLNYLALFLILIVGFSCSSSSNEQTFDSSALPRLTQEQTEKIIEDFIMAEDGQTIEIPSGRFELCIKKALPSLKKEVLYKLNIFLRKYNLRTI